MDEQTERNEQQPVNEAVPVPVAKPERLFDRAKLYELSLLSGVQKLCRLRFPTDAEMCELSRNLVRIERFSGEVTAEDEAAAERRIDSAYFGLFEQLRQTDDGGDEFTPAEAAAQIQKLNRADVVDSVREGNQFIISLNVAGAQVEHTLNAPTVEDVRSWVRKSRRRTPRRHHQEIRTFLEPVGELWDRLLVRVDGYADPKQVPISHREAAAIEAMNLRAEVNEPDPEA